MRLAAAFVSVMLLAGHAHAADVVIGAVYPESDPARDAIAIALEVVNGTHDSLPLLMGAGGGLDRVGGARLTAAFASGDPAAAAERLVDEQHAVALTGGSGDAAVAAISHVAEAHGLPYLALESRLANPDGLTWFFRIGRTEARDARNVLQLLAAAATAHGQPFMTVALVFEDSPAGRERIAPVRAAAASLHVIDAPVPPGAPLPDAVRQAVVGASPNAVLSTLGGADEIARLAGLPPSLPLVLLVPGVDAAPDGVFRAVSFTLEPLPGRPAVDPLDAAFKARTGRPLGPAAARTVAGMLLLADVINRAGSTKPIDLRTALMATDTPGSELPMLWEGIRFDDSGQNVRATPALQQVQSGAFTTVLPEEIAVAPPRWP